jgi:hypothetical protein
MTMSARGRIAEHMLCLADRLDPNFSLWKKALSTGASLLWRTRLNADLPLEEVLADGSYLSRIYPAEKDKRKKRNGLVVRVIEYQLEGVEGAEPLYRLITTLSDAEKYPAGNWQPCQPFPPEDMASWLETVVREILQERIRPRKGRYGPRGVKRKMSGYPIRRSCGPMLRRNPKEMHRKIP